MHSDSPFRKALRESRTVIVPALLLVLGFNLFASNRLPWLREPVPIDQASDDDLFGSDTNYLIDTVSEIDTIPQDTADTIPTPQELEQMRQDSLRKSREDSIKRAREDSIRKGKEQESEIITTPGEVKGITTAQTKKILDQGKALIIDARRSDQFAKGHIPSAINIYAYEFADNIPKVMNVPKDKLVVIYCDGGLCELSHELSEELIQFGFKKIVIYTGGWEEWSKTDYPKATGE